MNTVFSVKTDSGSVELAGVLVEYRCYDIVSACRYRTFDVNL